MRSVRCRCAVAACVGGLVFFAWTPSVSAQGEEASADLSAQARELYGEGIQAAKLGQWTRARAFLLGAWRAQQHWQIAANLGWVELELGRHRDAAEHLTIFLRASRGAAAVTHEDRADAQRMLTKVSAKVGSVVIEVEPAGAEVSVDGVSIGTAPLDNPVFVEPGQRVIVARRDGYLPASATREVIAGVAATAGLRLVPMPSSLRWKTIVIGGSAASATAAVTGVVLAAWSNATSARSRAYQRDPTRCAASPATSGSAGALCQQFDDLQSQRARQANASFWSFMGAGALAAGTTAYALLAPKQSAPVTVGAFAAPGGAAAALSFEW